MKTLKIVIVFALILGGIFSAFYMIDNKGSIELPPIDDDELATYRKQFETDWERVGDWDEAVFSGHCDVVKQLSVNNETNALNDLNTSTAVEVIFTKIFEKWKNTNCSKQEIDKYANAIKTIEKTDANATSNPSVKKIRDVYNTYLKAYNLAHRGIGLSVNFNGKEWNSYSYYVNSIESQKTNILNNENYKTYLSNIADIKNGLNSISEKLVKGRERFYSSLAQDIINHFSDIVSTDRTREHLIKLRNIVSKYKEEYTLNQALSDFDQKFAKDVYKNEESENEESENEM